MAAFALTGIGGLVGAGWLTATGNFLFSADIIATATIAGYKGATGTLTTEDLLMAGLSLGPLAVGKAIQFTGLAATLTPKLKNSLKTISDIIGKSEYTQKLNEMFSSVAKGARGTAGKIESIFEERMLGSWIKGTKQHLDPNLAGKLDELWTWHKAGRDGALEEIKSIKEMVSRNSPIKGSNFEEPIKWIDEAGKERLITPETLALDARGIKFLREVKSVNPKNFKSVDDIHEWIKDKIEDRVAIIIEAKTRGAVNIQDLSRIEFTVPKNSLEYLNDDEFTKSLTKTIIDLNKKYKDYGIKIELIPL